jgi:4-carboxymuconolactone decarboxylase
MKIFLAMLTALLMTGPLMHAEERFQELTPDKMTSEQKKVAEAIMSGPRKGLRGPFNTWLRSPELADRLQKVGEHIRYASSLPARLNEFAILITAREWTAQYEWFAHYPFAIKGGLSPEVAADLATGKRPSGMQDDEKIVYDFCTQLQRDRTVSDATFKAAIGKFGEQGVVDLIGVIGYYGMVSMTLNVAQVGLPPGEALPLPVLKHK